MRRILAFVDWRFIFSIALLIIVLMVGHSYWTAQKESAAKDARVDRLIFVHDRERAAASAERRELLAGQRAIEADSERIADRYAALVAWLQARGYRVPVGLIAPGIDTDGDGDDDSDQVDRDADQRERAARPKAPSPSKGNGGGSGGGGNGGGGDGPGDGGQRPDRGNGRGNDKDDRGHGQGRDKGDRRNNGNGRGRG